MKICTRCKRNLHIDAFSSNRSKSDGKNNVCKPCDRERKRQKAHHTPEIYKKKPAPVVSEEPEIIITTDPPTDEEITDSLLKEYKEQNEDRSLLREKKALIAENIRLRDTITLIDPLFAHVPNVTAYSPTVTHLGEAVPCALASDWHVEEPVEAHAVQGLNEYNLEIAKQRSEKFFQSYLKMIRIVSRDSTVKRVWLGLLGDFFSGFIHEELQETNLLGPTEAAKYVTDLLVSGIKFLLRELPADVFIDIDAIPGNHGRMTKKMRIHNATETSLETFMYHAVSFAFSEEPRVSMRVARAPMVFREYFERFSMRLIHGYEIMYNGGIGGVTIPVRKKIAAWDKAKRASLTCMGHFHQFMDGGDFIVNGSLIGYAAFGQFIGASPEEARQAFFLIHARNGGEKSIVAPLWVT